MIHRAKFQNFKALRDVEVTFDSRLTVLVGPNGSGKTSVLQGVHALSQFTVLSSNDPDFALPKLADFIANGERGMLRIAIEGTRPEFGEYSVESRSPPPSSMSLRR